MLIRIEKRSGHPYQSWEIISYRIIVVYLPIILNFIQASVCVTWFSQFLNIHFSYVRLAQWIWLEKNIKILSILMLSAATFTNGKTGVATNLY